MTRLPLYLAASALLAGCATQVPLTDFTAGSGGPRAPEQLAVTFDKADLALRVDPATRSIRGDAALTFTANALATTPLTRIAVELDRNLPVDGDAGQRRRCQRVGGEGQCRVAADALRGGIDAQRQVGFFKRDGQLLRCARTAGVGREVGQRNLRGGAAGQQGAGGE